MDASQLWIRGNLEYDAYFGIGRTSGKRRNWWSGGDEWNSPIQEVLGRIAISGTGEGDLLHGVSRDCVSLTPTF